ncbi:hypothetical protein PR003_g26644 [Phytophthora rubi]|uniref:Uncharacterized protein n=1 Tax=Phytophthora rubi TaxID=129364 RepID=A0A6A4CDV5_9STRA|nr:hypothetical protein PR001_g25789 [Phytophthora rubi]KAE8976406.1 hypothetical protein PR002_g25321 [Phytophthora rubi]KAE9285222.1 hypothetical protein PR003_g26644 [Phytophthora rubi]
MQHVLASLTLFAACLAVSVSSVAATPQSGSALITGAATMDPSDIVNGQFAAVPAITSSSSPSDVVDWLVGMDDIFTRVATGGLSSLPPNGIAAMKTMETDITATPALLTNALVLKRLLHVLPSLWDIGFWYRPVSEWKTSFGCIFNNAVAASKVASDASCYDAAVNATALMIRFTKDQVFWDGEDHGDSVQLQGQNKEYLAYLPELVERLSKQEHVMVTEEQLRNFMATKMPSKTKGMDMSVAFPVYVDTSIYRASDAAALESFVCS